MKPGPQSSTFRPGLQHMPMRRGQYARAVKYGVAGWRELDPVPETGGCLLGCGIALLLAAALVGAVACALEAK